ncbi:MAG: hypothetical protein AB8F34_09075 [Akkermansiaceae bacterium]
MSKKESPSSSGSSKDDQAPDLSALDFGPAWAKKDSGNKSKNQPAKKPQQAPKHAPKGKGGGRKFEPRRNGGQRGDNPRRGRKPDHRDRRDHKPPTPPAEGVAARIMPIEEGMDNMAKEISAAGRTHSVFDLAWLVLGGMDRFHVIFESEENPLYQSKKDHSVWLTKNECLRHFWSSRDVENFYEEEITEGESPSGNFQSVAKCGLSGKLIGPPNHHSYQQTLQDLHRERYGNMSLDRYKSKIVMEHGEDAVEKWIEQEKKQSVWRPKSKVASEPEKTEETTDDQAAPESAPADEVIDDTAAGEVTDAAPDSLSDGKSDQVEVTQPEKPIIDDAVPVFKSRREVEQHFLTSGFDEAFTTSKTISVLANVPPKMISPGLTATLRHVVAEEKRYPGKLASFLCRQMSGRHLAVFKWKKRLHCGPARPKHVPSDMVMADRPSKLFHWVLDHPSGKLDKMWKDCLPAEVDDETRHAWYHDLHWLINEGLVLLFSDGTLHAAKEQQQAAPKKSQAKKKEKPSEEKAGESTADKPESKES